MKSRYKLRTLGLLLLLSSLALLGCENKASTDEAASKSTTDKEPGSSLVLVTGITGTQGSGVATTLLEKGYQVRGLTRNPDSDRAKFWRDRGVEMVKGDFNDYASIDAAVRGVDYLFVNVVEQTPNFVDAAKNSFDAAQRAGVQHIVFTSNRLSDPELDFVASKLPIELYLRASGYSYTTLRIPQLMGNLIRERNMQRVLTEGVVSLGPGTSPKYYFAAEDLGPVTAAAFADSAAWSGREINLAADALTDRDIASLISELSGLEIKYSTLSWDQARGPFVANFKYLEEHDLPHDGEQFKQEFPDTMTLREYLQMHNYGEKLVAIKNAMEEH